MSGHLHLALHLLPRAQSHKAENKQSSKLNNDSACKAEEIPGSILGSQDEDQAYNLFLECLDDKTGKTTPEAASTGELDDSFKTFLDVLHDKATPNGTEPTKCRALNYDDSAHMSSSSQ